MCVSNVTAVRTSSENSKKLVLEYQYYTTFESPKTVYFAHTFPYTCSDLQLALCKMEQAHRSGFFSFRDCAFTVNRSEIGTGVWNAGGSKAFQFKMGNGYVFNLSVSPLSGRNTALRATTNLG